MKVTNLDEFFTYLKGLPRSASHEILTKAVSHLFNTVGKEDILKVQDKKMYFQGRELDENGVHQLVEEAKFFKTSKLYKVLQAELRYQANKRMFLDSSTIEDLIAGKILLLYIDIIETRLKELK